MSEFDIALKKYFMENLFHDFMVLFRSESKFNSEIQRTFFYKGYWVAAVYIANEMKITELYYGENMSNRIKLTIEDWKQWKPRKRNVI